MNFFTQFTQSSITFLWHFFRSRLTDWLWTISFFIFIDCDLWKSLFSVSSLHAINKWKCQQHTVNDTFLRKTQHIKCLQAVGVLKSAFIIYNIQFFDTNNFPYAGKQTESEWNVEKYLRKICSFWVCLSASQIKSWIWTSLFFITIKWMKNHAIRQRRRKFPWPFFFVALHAMHVSCC